VVGGLDVQPARVGVGVDEAVPVGQQPGTEVVVERVATEDRVLPPVPDVEEPDPPADQHDDDEPDDEPAG